MIKLFSIFGILLVCLVTGFKMQESDSGVVPSQLYKWEPIPVTEVDGIEKKDLLNGKTRDLENLDIDGIILKPGQIVQERVETEVLLIIKKGPLLVTVNQEKQSLDKGSVALVFEGDGFIVQNQSQENTSFYMMEYESKLAPDYDRGRDAGSSFLIDWNDLEYIPYDRGGTRKYFNRPTNRCERFEMHVTTLKPGLKSHDPHTHRSAEIILMIEGNSEELIGENHYQGGEGDFYYIESELLHGIQNIGEQECMYFAFQWH